MKKLLFDFFPILLFFIAYRLGLREPQVASDLLAALAVRDITLAQAPILLATAVAIATTALQVLWVKIIHHRVERMMLITLALMVVLGGATLFFHDPDFIKWKPTALYWLFAVVLGGGAWIFGNNLLRRALEPQLRLPDAIWARLNLIWVAFFIFMGALNLYVARNFSEAAWVNFKLIGGIGLMFAFVIAQAFWLSRHIKDELSAG